MAEGAKITNTQWPDRFKPGEPIGVSAWIPIDQAMITRFGETTLDPDPMHVDPEWAAEKSPFGHTVAFGFLTMSLLTHLLHDAAKTSGLPDPTQQGYYLNYGFDRLRFVSPVPAGARVRGRFETLSRVIDEKGRHIVKIGAQVEIEGGARPALVAEWLTAWVPPGEP